jgi:hypothetical protein
MQPSSTRGPLNGLNHVQDRPLERRKIIRDDLPRLTRVDIITGVTEYIADVSNGAPWDASMRCFQLLGNVPRRFRQALNVALHGVAQKVIASKLLEGPAGGKRLDAPDGL